MGRQTIGEILTFFGKVVATLTIALIAFLPSLGMYYFISWLSPVTFWQKIFVCVPGIIWLMAQALIIFFAVMIIKEEIWQKQ